MAGAQPLACAPVSDPLVRQLELLMLLRSAPPLTWSEIIDRTGLYADTGETSRATFERDKRALRALGVPISTDVGEGDAGATRYTVRSEDYDLPDLSLTADERLALSLAAAAVQLDTPWDDGAVRKIGGGGAGLGAVLASLPALEQLPVLDEAVRRRRRLAFTYSGRPRDVVPVALLFRNGQWYLVAVEADQVKTFRIDRLAGELGVGEDGSAGPTPPVDLDAVLPPDPMQIGGGESVVARIRLARHLAGRATRLAGAEIVAVGEDGSVEVELSVVNRAAFLGWVLGLREHAEVLGPPELRDDIVAWLHEMAA